MDQVLFPGLETSAVDTLLSLAQWVIIICSGFIIFFGVVFSFSSELSDKDRSDSLKVAILALIIGGVSFFAGRVILFGAVPGLVVFGMLMLVIRGLFGSEVFDGLFTGLLSQKLRDKLKAEPERPFYREADPYSPPPEAKETPVTAPEPANKEVETKPTSPRKKRVGSRLKDEGTKRKNNVTPLGQPRRGPGRPSKAASGGTLKKKRVAKKDATGQAPGKQDEGVKA